MKNLVMISILAVAMLAGGCVSCPSVSFTPPLRGRIVYSATMNFPDKSTVHVGAPVTNVPIRLSVAVVQHTRAFGDGGPHWEPKKAWHYYTFADSNGCFRVPMLWGFYLSTHGIGTHTERSRPEFVMIEPTGNVKIEKGEESIRPFIGVSPNQPVLECLRSLRTLHASPLHAGDEAHLKMLLGETR